MVIEYNGIQLSETELEDVCETSWLGNTCEELASGVKKDELNGWFVGSPVHIYYDYEKTGIWQFTDSAELALYTENDFEVGDIKIKDQNNDSTIDEKDRVIIGQRDPKWYGSLTNHFEYKGFDLNIMIIGRFGHTIRDNILNQFQIRDNYAESGMKVDYWTPVNPTNEAPRLNPAYSGIGYVPYSSSLLYTDGSWVKVRDITLGYTIPQILLTKIRVSSLRIYISAQNPLVIYSPLYAKGRYDPEKNGGTSWPMPKTFLAGLTLDF